MFLLGVAGGIASGKSEVTQQLAQHGAKVLMADAIGHKLLNDSAVKQQLVARWTNAICDSAGNISRPAVAAIVFAENGDAEREFLNKVLHPLIKQHLESHIATFAAQQISLVVLDAALLFETGWNTLCHGVLFIDTPEEQRWQQAAQRGWSRENFLAREAAQWPVEKKKVLATWCMKNNGSLQQLHAAIENWYRETLYPLLAR